MRINPEHLDLLDRLSPEEFTIYIYRYIFELTDTEIVDCRQRYRLTYLDCQRAINRIYHKRRKNNDHSEKIAALQEICSGLN